MEWLKNHLFCYVIIYNEYFYVVFESQYNLKILDSEQSTYMSE